MALQRLSYREMALQFPVAGSVYSYVRLGTNDLPGFHLRLDDPARLPAPSGTPVRLRVRRHGVPGPLRAGLGLGHRLRRGNGPHQHHGRHRHRRDEQMFLYIQLRSSPLFVGWATVLIVRGDAYLSFDVLIPSSSSASLALVISAVPDRCAEFHRVRRDLHAQRRSRTRRRHRGQGHDAGDVADRRAVRGAGVPGRSPRSPRGRRSQRATTPPTRSTTW